MFIVCASESVFCFCFCETHVAHYRTFAAYEYVIKFIATKQFICVIVRLDQYHVNTKPYWDRMTNIRACKMTNSSESDICIQMNYCVKRLNIAFKINFFYLLFLLIWYFPIFVVFPVVEVWSCLYFMERIQSLCSASSLAIRHHFGGRVFLVDFI